ncbi:hypothetical protein [Cetobacterium sp.]|uniref:hypothetical protein n=1 Tax=Cetobacterium sp. TaxID=2071632 RepID=UPI003F2EDAE0
MKKKRALFSVGFNNHIFFDNAITLTRSSNDIFDGTLDYIYFKVLGCDPVMYFNLIEEEELTEEEKNEYQFYFEEYEKKHKILMNKNFCEELKELIFYLRDISLEENMIKPELGYYIPNSNRFSLKYIMIKILKFYRGKNG